MPSAKPNTECPIAETCASAGADFCRMRPTAAAADAPRRIEIVRNDDEARVSSGSSSLPLFDADPRGSDGALMTAEALNKSRPTLRAAARFPSSVARALARASSRRFAEANAASSFRCAASSASFSFASSSWRRATSRRRRAAAAAPPPAAAAAVGPPASSSLGPLPLPSRTPMASLHPAHTRRRVRSLNLSRAGSWLPRRVRRAHREVPSARRFGPSGPVSRSPAGGSPAHPAEIAYPPATAAT